MDEEAQREHASRAATTYAAAADHFTRPALGFWDRRGTETVARVPLSDGDTVLDVCCGAGASALPAAQRVAPRGRVLGIDLAEPLLEAARRRGAERGLAADVVSFRQADATATGLADGSFDAVICVFGVFFAADMPAFVAEMWRLVRPGGRLAITTWGPGFGEPGAGVFWNAVHEIEPSLFRGFNPWDEITTPAALRELLVRGGVAAAALEATEGERHPLDRPEDFWEIVLGSGYRATVNALDPSRQAQLRERVIDEIRARRITAIGNDVVFALAQKPDCLPQTNGDGSLGPGAPMDLDLLSSTLSDLGEPAFRARQVWRWLAQGADGYGAMTDLPLGLRAALADQVPLSTLTLAEEAHARDGTVKALFHTADGRPVEAVLMRYRDGRRSLCLSSQSGCPLTCTFCATGSMRFGRNLTAWEILDQALHFRRTETVDHAVFMGMGEPMMNLDNVLAACTKLPDVGISHRHTAISTVGWIPGIRRLAEQPMPLRLALSLHAADDDLRTQIMPVNERYPLADVLTACRELYERKRRMIFVEYVMLAGVNDSFAQARRLAEVLDPRVFKVNLIPYNPTDSPYEGSGPKAIEAFRAELERRGIGATVRLTRGRDIAAACGQLAAAAPASPA